MLRKKSHKKNNAPRIVKKNTVTILRSATADMMPRLTPTIMQTHHRPTAEHTANQEQERP